MPDLHLTGVHEDGENLLLSSADGITYRLILDDALRAAVRRGPAHEARSGPAEPLRPVDVQAMIRAGATAEEAAERAGWPVEKVHRYEGPILAERAHVAGLAASAHLRGRSGQIVTLLERVDERLRQRGVDPDDADWDAWRSQDGHWTVDISFSAGGRRRTASWHFSRSAMTVTPVDDESRWLGEDDTPDPSPSRREVVARHDVYDVESDPRDRRRVDPPDPDSEIMSSLRERAAARTHRRRTARRLPTDSVASSQLPTPPRSTDVGFASSSPTDVPHRDADVPVDAIPLEPHGYDPDTMAPPPGAHAAPDADGIDGRPEPAAAAYASDSPGHRRATAPATPDPVVELSSEPTAPEPSDRSAAPSASGGASDSAAQDSAQPPQPTQRRPESVASDSVHEPELPLAAEPKPDTASRVAEPDGDEPTLTGASAEPSAQTRTGAEEPGADRAAGSSQGAKAARGPRKAPARRRSRSAAPAAPPPPTTPDQEAAREANAPGPAAAPAEVPAHVSTGTQPSGATDDNDRSSEPGPASPSAPEKKRPAKRGRASVPAWDDIMFGAKGPTE